MEHRSCVFRFADLELDERNFSVTKAGEALPIEPKVFKVLQFLLHHRDRVVTKSELLDAVWDDCSVSESSLTRSVATLRHLLGDDIHEPRFIATVPTVGYRFLCNVTVTEDGFPPEVLGESPPETVPSSPPARISTALIIILFVAGSLVLLILFPWHRAAVSPRDRWVQITDFSDSATSPVLSPDGRMIAFLRGPDTFVTRGQIYVKFLPDGRPVQLTHDDALKMAPAFSPDGSRIAYTTTDPGYGWNSWVVPVLGGEPEKLLPNAAALTWVNRQHVMFSEAGEGSYMSVVTATESRADERDVYRPAGVNGMAHRSWISPDRKWVLVAEMDSLGWLPCRLLPFDGTSVGEAVGPQKARCTSAGWSPDGQTMYFSADAGDGYHLWCQHFPRGLPEQLTFGPTEEEGITVSPDGRSLVTSAGIRESTVWVHDLRGDRQVSGEGFALMPGLGFAGGGDRSVFSPDGKRLFYLQHKGASRAHKSGELWASDMVSGTSEVVLPGILMSDFYLASDGERVAFIAQDAQGISHAWIASLDRRTPPKQLTSSVTTRITFVPGGDIYLLVSEEGQEFLYRLAAGQTTPQRVSPEPIRNLVGISPHAEWLISGNNPVIARHPQGGPAIRLCNFCGIAWGLDGKFYLRFRDIGEMGGGKVVVLDLPPGKDLPALPPAGLNSIEDARHLSTVAEIDTAGEVIFAPGPNPSTYAYVRRTVQRNLFRIPRN